MEIQGKIIAVLPLQSGVGANSGNPWKKQEYVLETMDSQYPRKICFNLWGDNIDKFGIQVGEDVTVQVDIESREWNGRWYTDVKAWRIDRGIVSLQTPRMAAPVASQAMPSSLQTVQSAPTVSTAPATPASAPEDDLPF